MLAETAWQGADLGGLVAAELAPFVGTGHAGPVVELRGPKVMLPPTLVQPLAIAIHELATNAVKHGALGQPTGRLELGWTHGRDAGLSLAWSEAGCRTTPPARSGFGTRVLDTTIQKQLGGRLRREWRATGLRCEISLPARLWTEPERPV